jgi:signal transduction histidine kinase
MNEATHRIIVIDDNRAIHDDFREILASGEESGELDALEADLFGDEPQEVAPLGAAFELSYASQGHEGVEEIRRAKEAGQPISMAFVDMRMPPGWDGLETIEHIWEVDPDVQVVICSAFSDYSWEEVIRRLGRTEKLLILKKPFDCAEVGQLANALTEKWSLSRQAEVRLTELGEMVRERTQDLEIARDQAEQSNRSKGQFLANMSHEIRTPINGIMGLAELLCGSELGTEQLDYAETILTSSQALLHVINDILDFSKIESGKMELEEVAFELIPLLDQVVKTLRPQAEARGILLRLDLDPALPERIVGDPHRIRQILYNLIGNGLKFTERGHVLLRARLGAAQERGQRLTLDIVDTGIGIAPEHLDKVFEKFTQADNSTTRRFGGTGLGLSISRQLVNLMDGEMSVESALGQGTTFHLSLPLVLPTASIPLGALAPQGCSAGDVASIRAHILLAEDNPVNQKVASAMLERLGCEVTLANDGREVLRLFGETRFDLVLMDCQMPNLDGYGATREIRALEGSSSHTPIVAMTANAMQGDRETCLRAGMDGYVSKPVSILRLTEALVQLLDAALITRRPATTVPCSPKSPPDCD